ncbi:MAG: ribulokinase [bacterium]
MAKYSIGLDYGTNSVRAVLVDIADGAEIAANVFNYPHGTMGILLDDRNPDLARQHPQDYLDGAVSVIQGVLKEATEKIAGFQPCQIVGIGVDTTGSTPLPVDGNGVPLAFNPKFADNLGAMVYLWKDHTGHVEAAEITALAEKIRPEYLAKCGGTYSSEWFWSKILKCLRNNPEVFDAAYTWVEHSDWLPAVICGHDNPATIKRDVCAAGHKAMFNAAWGGYPDAEFLAALDPKLLKVRQTLPNKAYHVGEKAGELTAVWAAKTGLPAGTPVSIGAFDAHLGAVASGIEPGVLVKIIGTSSCDMMVESLDKKLPDVPGLCGIVPESILPDNFGLEAGQSAVGDIFNWFVNIIQPANMGHFELTEAATKAKPGMSGLLALDWNNGNRTVLVDPRLTGLMLGMTLQTTPAEMYRALVESTAFGARVIMERFEEYGMKVDRIVNCGGISAKNTMVMQIYADIMGRPLAISSSAQTCALGAAICGAVVAGEYATFADATKKMTSLQEYIFEPIPENQVIYNRLYIMYRRIHDAFGVKGSSDDLSDVMKELLKIRDEVRVD